MRKLLPIVALSGLLGFTACTDPYGNVDPLATGLLAAGVGAAAGVAIASSAQPRYGYYAPPPPRYGWGRPAYVYSRPHYYGRPHYGWGHGRRYW